MCLQSHITFVELHIMDVYSTAECLAPDCVDNAVIQIQTHCGRKCQWFQLCYGRKCVIQHKPWKQLYSDSK